MTFHIIDWSNPEFFKKNLQTLFLNFLKIKFFYEEDQITLPDFFAIAEMFPNIYKEYAEKAEEITIYFKVIAAFHDGSAKLPNQQKDFDYVLEYFEYQKNSLDKIELSQEERFIEWLKNGEFNSWS